jgi:hypothetical protein
MGIGRRNTDTAAGKLRELAESFLPLRKLAGGGEGGGREMFQLWLESQSKKCQGAAGKLKAKE